MSFILPLISFFFVTIPPPPNSTLFPYTTLFRSAGAATGYIKITGWVLYFLPPFLVALVVGYWQRRKERSEEHTSELQSRQYLVCRLLLEKKKNDTDAALQSVSSESRLRVGS